VCAILASQFARLVDLVNQSNEHTPAGRNVESSDLCLAAGVFFSVLAVYMLANPGRIDTYDGQVRYELTINWLTTGRPVLRDPALLHSLSAVIGKKGFTYSTYGPAALVAAMPLVWVGTFYDDPPGEATRSLFPLTTTVFGALAAGVLYLFYTQLGVSAKKALAWTGIAAFATLMWPASDSTFDNGQHASLVLVAVFLGYMSGERKSRSLAALGGLVAGLLLDYQAYFAFIIPLLALSTMDWDSWGQNDRMAGARVLLRPFGLLLKLDGKAALRELKDPTGLSREEARAFRRACRRCGLFLLATLVGVALALDFNYFRFGSLFLLNGKMHYQSHRAHPLFGNPLAGFLTLLVSPGKSILLYSPPLILGFAGLRGLWRHKPQMGFVIVAASVVLVLFISTIAFAGGDWCWGPRYLTPLVPLWALAFPFAPIPNGRGRDFAAVIVGAGLVVQCLAVSVENQRFFFERGLEDSFWAKDPWCYFKRSALLARPGETLSLIKGPPRDAVLFNTDNNPPTYTAMGPPPAVPRSRAPVWMRQFRVFYVPKPWGIWMWDIPPDQRALNLPAWLAGISGVALLGLALVQRGLQHGF